MGVQATCAHTCPPNLTPFPARTCKCFSKFQIKKEGHLSEEMQGLVRKAGPQEHSPHPHPCVCVRTRLALSAALELDAVILPLLSMGDRLGEVRGLA